MSTNDTSGFAERIEKVLDGAADADEFATLDRRLAEDSRAAQYYVDTLLLHLALSRSSVCPADRAEVGASDRMWHSRPRLWYPAWAAGIAACLIVGVLGWWVVSSRGIRLTGPTGPIASPREGTELTIQWLGGNAPIAPGTTLQTSAGEVRSLILNGRHQLVMNAGTKLSIEPLVERGRAGCQVNLALGEIYVHVAQDGHPFIVQTPHARAVITGTTFDVQVTEAGTTLVVAEGRVCFESQAGVVHVTTNQRSMIAASVAVPTVPTSCDAVSVMAWARADRSAIQAAQDPRLDDLVLDDLPLLPAANVQTDLEDVSYPQWVEQNRDWFQRQFPEIFRLKAALAQDGLEVDYPDLLLKSGVLWQFAYPPVGEDRLLAIEEAAILKAASRHGKDASWLRERGLLPIATTAPGGQRRIGDAFALWQNEVAAAADSGKELPQGLLLESLHACAYLRQTRSLLWLTVETDRYSVPGLSKAQLQALLQAEVTAAAGGVGDVIRLLVTERSLLPCDSDPYRRLVRTLCEAMTQMAQTEGRLADEMVDRRP